jgi:hypothetical protein
MKAAPTVYGVAKHAVESSFALHNGPTILSDKNAISPSRPLSPATPVSFAVTILAALAFRAPIDNPSATMLTTIMLLRIPTSYIVVVAGGHKHGAVSV